MYPFLIMSLCCCKVSTIRCIAETISTLCKEDGFRFMQNFTSNGTSISLKFHSDIGVTRNGFFLSYREIGNTNYYFILVLDVKTLFKAWTIDLTYIFFLIIFIYMELYWTGFSYLAQPGTGSHKWDAGSPYFYMYFAFIDIIV